jgi:hypothetical protein
MKRKKCQKLSLSLNINPCIYHLCSTDFFYKYVKKIKHYKIQTTMYYHFKKGIASSEQLFLINVDSFLSFINYNFLLPDDEKIFIFRKLVEGNYCDFLITPKDINSNIELCQNEYKMSVVKCFYDSMCSIKKFNNHYINNTLDKYIDFNHFDINDKEVLNKTFSLVKDIINCSRYEIHSLFYKAEEFKNQELLISELTILLENYENRKQYLEGMGM